MKKLAEELGMGLSELKKLRETHEGTFKTLVARVENMEAAMATKGINLPGSEPTAKKAFSIAKALRFITAPDKSDTDLRKECGFEIDVMREARKANEKTLNTLVGSAGGFFVPEQAIPDFIPLLRAGSVLRAAGARPLDGLVGSPVTIPGLSGGATIYWRGEGQPGTKSQQTALQKTLTPKLAMGVVPVTRELLLQGTPSVDAMITEDIAAAMALEVETQQVIGIGSSFKPLGIVNHTGLNSVNSVSNTATLTTLLDMMASVKAQNVQVTRGAFLMHSNVLNRILKQRVDGGGGAGTGDYVFKGVADIAQRIGYPIFEANYLRTNLGSGNKSEILFGNMPDAIVATWGGLILEASNEATDAAGNSAFMNHETWIKIGTMVDSLVRQPKAFAYCNDVTGDTI